MTHATGSHPDDSYDTIVPDSDGPALESSSQSSHDNGEPETPSPLYSQPVANIVDPSLPVQEDIRQALPTGGIDPHIARIMNALTLSASGANKHKVSSSDVPAQTSHAFPTSISQPPTVPAIPTPNHSDDPKEVSSAALINNSNPLYNAYPLASSSPSQGPIVSNQTHPSLLKTPTTATSILQRGATPGPLPHVLTAPSHSPETRSVKVSIPLETHAQPAQKKVSRRSSSTVVDVSPYLSRPTETPASAKQMKQLALLESIADESERTAHNNLMKQPSVNPLTLINGHPVHGRQPYLPPASVPPMALGGAGPGLPNANGLLYSSGLRQPYDSLGNLANPLVPPPRPPSSAYDDPFQVRPRTSQTFRPIPPPPPPVLLPLVQPPQHHPSATPFPPGHPAGAPQNPLLAILNTPMPGPAGLTVYGAPNMPPQGSHPGYPMHPTTAPVNGMMNGQMARSPAMPMVPPASAPAMSPLFPNMQPRPSSRANLLSLLNNPAPM
jgi:mRNA-decapping enzyme subunit 2